MPSSAQKPNFLIAVRFLIAKRRAMLMSLTGIIFGVAFFIVTQSQATGFQQFFIRTILGANGAIRVQDRFQSTVTNLVVEASDTRDRFQIPLREGATYVPGIGQPGYVLDAVRSFTQVTGASPVLRGNVEIRSGFRTEQGRLHGIELATYLDVSELANQTTAGGLDVFERQVDGILIGRVLAERLGVGPGDTLFVSSGGEDMRFRVSALFETGIELVDKSYFYAHLRTVRQVLQEWDGVSYIQAMLEDPNDAPLIAKHMEYALGHSVASWQERERSWLEVFRVLRLSSALTMSTIILIAGLGMFNTLAIIVMERAREIAILRSIGYERRDILKIFLYQGMLVYVIGAVVGCLMGAGLTALIESIPFRIRGIFSTDNFIMHWSIAHYLWAIAVAGVVVFLASLVPARRAARVEPGQVIRGVGA
jgi:lipoprotein-releasing system permease protein